MSIDFFNDRKLTNIKSSRSDLDTDIKLRPSNFSEFVGQKKIIENITLMTKASNIRKDSMDHVLLSGPPGLGKTSLSLLISKELNSQLHILSAPALDKKGDIAAILTNLNPRDVLFIDEIHRMNSAIEEILYSAMEDYHLDIIIGQNHSARTMRIDISPFTLVGATTRSGLLSNPFRDRFMGYFHFDFYSEEELSEIISINAKKLALIISDEAKVYMAKRSRGTPRIANRILRRVRDFALVKGRVDITIDIVENAISMMGIDNEGLSDFDRRILLVIENHYFGGPVGIDALCATLGEERGTIEDVYEPFLLQHGFILRTIRGRQITKKAREHLRKIGSNIEI